MVNPKEIPDEQAALKAPGSDQECAEDRRRRRSRSRSGRRTRCPPFITSTLQQAASSRLRFSAKKTMMIAQQLYEGMPIGGNEITGLITYMRTDSPVVSERGHRAGEGLHPRGLREELPPG